MTYCHIFKQHKKLDFIQTAEIFADKMTLKSIAKHSSQITMLLHSCHHAKKSSPMSFGNTPLPLVTENGIAAILHRVHEKTVPLYTLP